MMVTLLNELTGNRAQNTQEPMTTNALSMESYMAMQKEQQERDIETKQRYYINLNAPSGYNMALAGQSPTTSIQLGVQ